MSPWATRAKQAGVILLGLAVTAVMIALGLWQLDVYGQQGAKAAEARANGPVIALSSVAVPGQAVGDGYGRTVSATGRWDSKLQVLVPTADGSADRVLTGLRLDGGGVLPVVRGQLTPRPSDGSTGPTPPTGEVTVQGILLGSEQDPGTNQPGTGSNELPAVELPILAQRWPVTLVNGFITLGPDMSRAQGLEPTAVNLPEGQGRSRNAAYALQWWIFAAFALGFGIRMARDIGRRDDYEFAEREGEPGDDPQLPGDGDATPDADKAADTDQPEVTEAGLSRRA
ncbi:cytochrome oxidase assembly protein ShyY1 [Friedmanniella endophytica]|uniref:SURF1-like protein n=1 Tax=Microlunatus kandeliicorticis TaxID=1759536 RepID=A0A7W3P559_9ACTN|nr:SURF1 family protein [Microlunatus kandeliicorticis]MBA8793621.1 cytochrome oxidase assembly protein ShyY1 [Microlunatus kandeliicorticis]